MKKLKTNQNNDLNIKVWNKGRKPATPELKQAAKERQKIRVKITNAVSRDNTIERKCCICGKENSPILHNKENPYLITFICKDCRKDKNNVKKANKLRFNLEEHRKKLIEERTDNYYLDTRKFTKEEVKEIIEDYIVDKNILNYGEYCKKNNISRYQFASLLDRYIEYFPEMSFMVKKVKNKSKEIQRNRLSIEAKHRNLQKIRNIYK